MTQLIEEARGRDCGNDPDDYPRRAIGHPLIIAGPLIRAVAGLTRPESPVVFSCFTLELYEQIGVANVRWIQLVVATSASLMTLEEPVPNVMDLAKTRTDDQYRSIRPERKWPCT